MKKNTNDSLGKNKKIKIGKFDNAEINFLRIFL